MTSFFIIFVLNRTSIHDIMKNNLLLLACMATALLLACCSRHQGGQATEFNIAKGVNCNGWMDAEAEVRHVSFTAEDFSNIKAWGFDHVRVPVTEQVLFNDDLTLNAEAVADMHKGFREILSNGLKIVFDLHFTRAHHFGEIPTLWTSEEEQERMMDIWKTLQGELKDYPVTELAYELLNEPMYAPDSVMNALSKRLVAQIRTAEPDRIIILPANDNNRVCKIKDMDVPEGDRNIMLSFHFYEPMLLTHYKASWTELGKADFGDTLQYPGRLMSDEVYARQPEEVKQIVVPESIYNKAPEHDKWDLEPYDRYQDLDWMRHEWADAISFAKEKGLRLYLGEFGCLPTGGEKSRLAWVKDVVTLAREYGIPYTFWEYNGGFGFADRLEKGRFTCEELKKALVD